MAELSTLGSVIKTAYEAEADTNAFTDEEKTKLLGVEDNATADQTNAEIETAYNAQVAKVSAGEITAGTEAAVRRYSPADVKAFVDAHAGGGGDLSATDIDTLAELNAILTDATLDDASNPRTPTAHTHPVADLSDASANAKTLLAAANYAAMRGLLNVEDGATADQSNAEIETAYNAQVSKVSAGEITAGTEAAVRRYSPADIKSFIDTHAGGGGDLSAADIDTLAELNAILTDATLDDASDPRTPTAHTHGTADLVDDAVTNAKLANVATATLKGRTTAGTGDPEDLTAAQARTLLSVETTTELNARDTANRTRSNHTGTQTLSTISDAGTAAALNAPASGDAASGEVVKGDDTRLTDARTPTTHYHPTTVSAGAMKPATTSGASLANVETSTNKVNFDGLDFSAATEQYGHFDIVPPPGATGMVLDLFWRDNGTAGTGAVRWGAKVVSAGDGEATDAAYSSAVEVDDTFLSSGQMHKATLPSLSVTPGEVLNVRIQRTAAHVNDTYTQPSRLRLAVVTWS